MARAAGRLLTMRRCTFTMILLLITMSTVPFASGWSNGSYGGGFGTHDWIVENAVKKLTADFPAETQWVDASLLYYGTELPDRSGCGDCIGDTFNHHIYFRANGVLQDDTASRRASAVYAEALAAASAGNWTKATLLMGAVAHYISDMAVFGHVMGAKTDWGAETHHADYEAYVNSHLGDFQNCMATAQALYVEIALTMGDSPGQLALGVAHDTTFDDSGHGLSAAWMDQHYDWSNAQFRGRSCLSLGVASGAVMWALHSFYVGAGHPIPEFTPGWPGVLLCIALTVALLRGPRRRSS